MTPSRAKESDNTIRNSKLGFPFLWGQDSFTIWALPRLQPKGDLNSLEMSNLQDISRRTDWYAKAQRTNAKKLVGKRRNFLISSIFIQALSKCLLRLSLGTLIAWNKEMSRDSREWGAVMSSEKQKLGLYGSNGVLSLDKKKSFSNTHTKLDPLYLSGTLKCKKMC